MSSPIDNFFILNPDDPAAFDRVYEEYGSGVLRYCMRHIGSRDDAEEIAEDAFMNLWRARHSLTEGSSLAAFLMTTTRHLVVDYYRRRANSMIYEAFVDTVHDHADLAADVTIQYEEFEEQIMMIIDHLPATQREALKLARLEGLSISETAQRLNLRQQTVKNAITSACNTLRRKLGHISMTILLASRFFSCLGEVLLPLISVFIYRPALDIVGWLTINSSL